MKYDLENNMSKETGLVLITVLTLFAALTRFYGLGDWPINNDEVFSVLRATERAQSLVNPASYILMAGSFELFGVSEWSARLYTVILGVLSIPLFYFTWKSVVGRNVAIVGAFLIVLSSWHLTHSQYARFYAGVFFFSSLAYFFFFQALSKDRLSYLIAACLASILAMSFHVTAVMVPASAGLYAILILVLPEKVRAGYSRRVAAIFVGLGVLASLALLPFLLGVLGDWGELHSSKGKTGLGVIGAVARWVWLVQLPVAVGAALGWLLLLKQDVMKGWFFGFGSAFPVIMLGLGASVTTVRADYAFSALPAVLLLAAWLCEQVRRYMAEYPIPSHAITILIATSLLPSFVSYYLEKRSLDVRETVSFIEENYRSGDHILNFSTGFRYYLDPAIPIDPHLAPLKKVGGWKKKLDPYGALNTRTWIVFPRVRDPLAPDLEEWLLNNARLVWRDYGRRIDLRVRGYEIFLIEPCT